MNAKELAKLWTAFDRSTAFMCRLRGVPFDLAKYRDMHATYFAALDQRCAELDAQQTLTRG